LTIGVDVGTGVGIGAGDTLAAGNTGTVGSDTKGGTIFVTGGVFSGFAGSDAWGPTTIFSETGGTLSTDTGTVDSGLGRAAASSFLAVVDSPQPVITKTTIAAKNKLPLVRRIDSYLRHAINL